MKFSVFIIFVLFLISCKKKEIEQNDVTVIEDYRIKYLGEFDFTTIATSWVMGQPTTYDTTHYTGSIKIYATGDNEKDWCSFDNLEEQNNRRLSIEFEKDVLFTPEVLESGVFIEKYGYHYGHSGKFNSSLDQVTFYIGGFGGLGGGTNYQIIGVRK